MAQETKGPKKLPEQPKVVGKWHSLQDDIPEEGSMESGSLAVLRKKASKLIQEADSKETTVPKNPDQEIHKTAGTVSKMVKIPPAGKMHVLTFDQFFKQHQELVQEGLQINETVKAGDLVQVNINTLKSSKNSSPEWIKLVQSILKKGKGNAKVQSVTKTSALIGDLNPVAGASNGVSVPISALTKVK